MTKKKAPKKRARKRNRSRTTAPGVPAAKAQQMISTTYHEGLLEGDRRAELERQDKANSSQAERKKVESQLPDAQNVWLSVSTKQLHLRRGLAHVHKSTIANLRSAMPKPGDNREAEVFIDMVKPLLRNIARTSLKAKKAKHKSGQQQEPSDDEVAEQETSLLKLILALLVIDKERQKGEAWTATLKRLESKSDYQNLLKEWAVRKEKSGLVVDKHACEVELSKSLRMFLSLLGVICGDETVHKAAAGKHGSTLHKHKPAKSGTMVRTATTTLNYSNMPALVCYFAAKEQRENWQNELHHVRDLARFDAAIADGSRDKMLTVDSAYSSLEFALARVLADPNFRTYISSSFRQDAIPFYEVLIAGMKVGELRRFALGPLLLTLFRNEKKIMKNLSTTHYLEGETDFGSLKRISKKQVLFLTDALRDADGRNPLQRMQWEKLVNSAVVSDQCKSFIAARYGRDGVAVANAASAADDAAANAALEARLRLEALQRSVVELNVPPKKLLAIAELLAAQNPGIDMPTKPGSDIVLWMTGLTHATYEAERKLLRDAKAEANAQQKEQRTKSSNAAVSAKAAAEAAVAAAGAPTSARVTAKRKRSAMNDALEELDDDQRDAAQHAARSALKIYRRRPRDIPDYDEKEASVMALYAELGGLNKSQLTERCVAVGIKTYKREEPYMIRRLLQRAWADLLDIDMASEMRDFLYPDGKVVMLREAEEDELLATYKHTFHFVDRFDTHLSKLQDLSKGEQSEDVRVLLWYTTVLITQTFAICTEEKAMHDFNAKDGPKKYNKRRNRDGVPGPLRTETVLATRNAIVEGLQKYLA